MMLQKKLVIGITALVFSSIALAANTNTTAQSPAATSANHETKSAQVNAQAQNNDTQDPPETVVSPGARLIAGEEKNEFYILDKNDPTPVVRPAAMIPASAVATGSIKEKSALAAANTQHNEAADIGDEFEDTVNTETATADESLAMQKQDKQKMVAVNHGKHGHVTKKNVAAVKVIKLRTGSHFAKKHAAVKAKLALKKSAKRVAVRKLVDQIEVISYAKARHVKSMHAAAKKKTVVHVETAAKKVKAKVASKKKSEAKVKVALNEHSNKEVFRDTVSTPEVY